MKRSKNFWHLLNIVLLAMLCVGCDSCREDDPDPDMVSVSLPSVNFQESGGTQSVPITSNTNWTVSGNPSWLTVAPISGSGNGSIMLTAQANTESSSRSCVLYVQAGTASTVIMVNQTKDHPDDGIASNYVGTLKPVGYTDAPAPCYVTITKLASTTYRLTSLICETFDINMTSGYNLVATKQSDGRISLTSETSYAIEGNYYQNTLTLNFAIGSVSFFFSGSKN